ncbi:MAG: Uroporphyrinogen decarboxylase [Hyphomicrobiaceae bacterium hypho_1]
MKVKQKDNTYNVGGKFINTLKGVKSSTPPIWLMRQAGRYLPEYRKIRLEADGFLNLCYTPKLATEVTLQPIKRYDFDAAILFSDILIVPHALGQNVEFLEGEGPCLDPIISANQLSKLDLEKTNEKFTLICETVSRVRQSLSSDKALIGFCGGPWTVATYMIAGGSTVDQAPARLFAYKDPETFACLIELITEASIKYLSKQIKAGADVVQLFDSWAGTLPEDEFLKWVIRPTKKIVSTLKELHPNIPVIGFPRASGPKTLDYINETGVKAIGCDTSLPLDYMRYTINKESLVLQGNLDPLLLLVGGLKMKNRINEILEKMRNRLFIFNLGHGILPQTSTENVTSLVETIRSFK